MDLLAVRLGNSEERIGVGENSISLKVDDEFFKLLSVTKSDTVGLVVEVKGGENERAEFSISKFDYIRPFFGDVRRIFKVAFERAVDGLCERGSGENIHYVVPLCRCLQFIDGRLKEVKKIERNLRGKGILSKEGSWHLSEEFLSELIYLKSLGYLGKGDRA